MTRFSDCIKLNNLGVMIDEQYGKYGKFSEEAADAVLQVARLEIKKPEQLIDLSAMLLFTFMNEATFDLHSKPNMNGHQGDVTKWDIGPGQLNVYWTRAAIKIGDIKPTGLAEPEYFGSFNTERFDGDPIANLRMVCRTLLSIRAGRDKPGISESLEETQCTHYTGPKARPARRENFRKYFGPMKEFFGCYTLETA